MPLVPAYTPTGWVDGTTLVNATRMNNIETATDAHADAINALDTRVTSEEGQPDIPTVVNGQWLKGSAGALVFSAIAIADVGSLQSTLDGKTDESVLTTKGDIYVATASATVTRQGVGANGTFLKADSAQSTGVSWATIAEGDVTGLVTDLAAKVAKADYTAKGMILAASAASTPAGLSVGSNNTHLVADSAQSSGVKWDNVRDAHVAAGQNLTKLSAVTGTPDGTKFLRDDGSWQAAGSAGAILATIVDVKGDIIVATAADTVARKAAGSDGTFLKAASAQADGLQWAALAESDISTLAATLATKTDKSTLTTKGDIYAATAASTPARLAVGTDGQFLKAASGQSTGLQWASLAIADVASLQSSLDGKADDNILTTKGDMYAATAASTPARVAVGANGTFLKANSAQATGVQWLAIAESDVTNLTTDLAAKVPQSLIDAAGDLFVGSANDTAARLAVGTAFRQLRVNSGATGLEWAGGISMIGDSTLGSDSASMDFTSIPSTYAHLLIAGYARASSAVATIALAMRMNGLTTAIYGYHYMTVKGTGTVTGAPFYGDNEWSGPPVAGNNASPSTLFSPFLIFIPHYAQATNRKAWVSVSYVQNTETTTYTSWETGLITGGAASSAAISQLTFALYPFAGNLKTGTRITIYGMGV